MTLLPIENALTPGEWAALRAEQRWPGAYSTFVTVQDGRLYVGNVPNSLPTDATEPVDVVAMYVAYRADQIPALMALANAALPSDSPYKLTWEMVDALRAHEERHFANVIASLLPPRVSTVPNEVTDELTRALRGEPGEAQ